MSYKKNLLLLHLTIFIWGASGVVGDLLNMYSEGIVLYRILFGGLFLGAYLYIKKILTKFDRQIIKLSLLLSPLIVFHWLCFFESIALSTISMGLICLSVSAFFVSILGPFFEGKIFKINEMILGVGCIISMGIIFKFEKGYHWGIAVGLMAALSSALYCIIMGSFAKKYNNSLLTFYQLVIGTPIILSYGFIKNGASLDWLYIKDLEHLSGLLFLGILCTGMAMSLYSNCLKTLNPFTVAISLNLEPLYGIIMAIYIYGKKEVMSGGFYIGGAGLFLCILVDSILKFSKITWVFKGLKSDN